MIRDEINRRAQTLAAERSPFVVATVVRVQRPASVKPGAVGLVLADGTIEGFIGGVCAQHSVRLHSLEALESGMPLLLRILPDGPDEVRREEGLITVTNSCLSGGAIEVFLEPVLPAPRVLVAGSSPIVAELRRLGAAVGFEIVAADDIPDGTLTPQSGDLALVVAAHGNDEIATLRAGLEAGVRYVGLVASRRRGETVIDELRGDGVADEALARLETPAGLDIGARTPPEVALSIVARIVELRRTGPEEGDRLKPVPDVVYPVTATDPICGMTVVVGADTLSLEHEGETVYFCSAACMQTFEERREPARSDG